MKNNLKIKIKYALEHTIQSALQLFRVFPLKKRVIFSSFSGRQYSDSPRRISELLHKEHPQTEQIWAFCNPQEFAFLKEKGIKTVKYKSFKYLFYVMTSMVYVDNVEFWSILKFRPKQMVLQTWHGGGAYKRIGQDRLDIGDLERAHAVEKMNKITLFLSSSKAFTDYVIRGSFNYSGEILECGLPRNDELKIKDEDKISEVRKELKIPEENKILLYAPTFRNDNSLEHYNIDFNMLTKALKERFGGQWSIVLRMHYYVAQRLIVSLEGAQIIDASDYPDMQYLLQAADVLITDYSSSMWDFLLTEKPCFLYATDIENYKGERDFYVPITQWPFPLAVNNEELKRIIASFDEAGYKKHLQKHYDSLGGCETGEATILSVKAIEDHLYGGRI